MVKLAVTLLCALAAPASAFISGGASAGLGLRASGNALFSQQRMPASWRRNVPIVSMSGVEEKKDTSDSGIGWDSHKAIDAVPDSLCRDGTANTEMRAKFEKMCREAQDQICAAVEACDGEGKFKEDAWTRENGGGGISRVLSGGKIWEKAGCNLSVVYGTMPSEALQAANDRRKFSSTDRAAGYKPGERVPFFACGLSSVMHPKNPHCPTMHFNYRYFETEGGVWWFGGGTDITPAYLDEKDMAHFHGTYKEVCDKHDKDFYPKFKAWADDYFMIKHRGETRGLGGIFFDDLNDREPEALLAFSTERGSRRRCSPSALRGGAGGAARLQHRLRRRRHQRLPPHHPRAQGRRVHGEGEGVAAHPPGAVRGVQPRLRPRHHLWPQDWGAHREHPDVAAGDKPLGVQPRPRARVGGGGGD